MQRVFLTMALFVFSLMSYSQSRLLSESDLAFLSEMTRNVVDSSRIRPGAVVTSESGPNQTGGTLIRPGGRADYPSFWIRDYAMSLESGFITMEEQKHMLLITASTQCDQTWITKGGSMIPFGSIADHIRIDNGPPIYFPGTYSFEDQGNRFFGMLPPFCDQFYFIEMAFQYVKTSSDIILLKREINGRRLIDRLEISFRTPPSRSDNGIVYATEDFRGVDFGFRDAIRITGDLSFPSILKYKSARQLAELFEKLHDTAKTRQYQTIARKIKDALPGLFLTEKGMLRASTGMSRQPDVWATALAVYYRVLEGEMNIQACKALADAYQIGTLASRGNIRHVLVSDDFNEMTAWEKTEVPKNTYQNGAYWGTPTGWVCYAISQVNLDLARKLAKDYIDDLRANDFRKGKDFGAPYECFYPPDYRQNPVYMTSVTCPFAVFKNIDR